MKTTILILAAIFLVASCSKNDDTPPAPLDQLPAITTTGANTAGCIINGKIIIPKNGINPTSGQDVNGLDAHRGINFDNIPYGNDHFAVEFSNLKDKGNSYFIYIHLNNLINGSGNYALGQSNGEFWSNASNNPQILVRETFDGVSGKTFLSKPNFGTIVITRFDYQNKILSGTFTATLFNKDNLEEKILVTEGRFDLKI